MELVRDMRTKPEYCPALVSEESQMVLNIAQSSANIHTSDIMMEEKSLMKQLKNVTKETTLSDFCGNVLRLRQLTSSNHNFLLMCQENYLYIKTSLDFKSSDRKDRGTTSFLKKGLGPKRQLSCSSDAAWP
eukprot:g35683.t1